MGESPPKTCPSCRYNLSGLPSAHRCPECGFEYDEQTVVWRPKSPWRPLRLLFPHVFALVMPIVTVGKLIAVRRVDVVEVIGTVTIFACVGFMTLMIIRQSRLNSACVRPDH